jgi:hypothetical protein
MAADENMERREGEVVEPLMASDREDTSAICIGSGSR